MKQVSLLLALFCATLQISAQFSLQGTVTDGENKVLTGAYVIIKDSYYRTTTDNNGNFLFPSMKKGTYQLQISFVGFNTIFEQIELNDNKKITVMLTESPAISDAVIISAVRAARNTPTTYSTLNREELQQRNSAQDLPYVLGLEPSVVTTSDAGAGVGYTSLRVRGSDITRINVTINGIPLNDPESHAVYWVDIPDFVESTNSLQLQRGIGSSTNGAGAFGASMNLETNSVQKDPSAAIRLSGGSFNTWKTSFQAGTGIINNHWFLDARASAIGSDGYIDRASSDLRSFFLQTGYTGEKTLVKALVFGGHEKTYQAWYGTDANTLKTDRTFNWAGALYDDDWNVTGFYDNQTDNYTQNHYQLHISHKLNNALYFNISGHLTRGFGYYEEYRQNETFADYGLNDKYFGADSTWNGSSYDHFYHDTVTQSDLIRRRWLDNYYYGITWSARYLKNKTDIIIGGALNKYDKARHFGEVIWSEYSQQGGYDYEYYENTSYKTDLNLFIKAAYSPVKKLTLYGDVQYRHIGYNAGGTENYLEPVNINESFNFFNPKAGISYTINNVNIYASYAIAHREPIRDDYLDAAEGEKPEAETLGDLEIGIRKYAGKFIFSVNYYLMNYSNQLVLTGAINDDGAYIRKNSGKSCRTGIEMEGGISVGRLMAINGNLSWSISKTDYLQSLPEGEIEVFDNTAIAFSPRFTGSGQVRLFPLKNMGIGWNLKFVGKQYLDNTQSDELMLKSYIVNDLRISYLLSEQKMPDIELSIDIYNLFNKLYESNGYVYDKVPYFYPQAGINYMAGINIKF